MTDKVELLLEIEKLLNINLDFIEMGLKLSLCEEKVTLNSLFQVMLENQKKALNYTDDLFIEIH